MTCFQFVYDHRTEYSAHTDVLKCPEFCALIHLWVIRFLLTARRPTAWTNDEGLIIFSPHSIKPHFSGDGDGDQVKKQNQ